MARQGIHGWAKDPARQEAARKASATGLDRERTINILIRAYEKRTGYLPSGITTRAIIDAVKAGNTSTNVIDELIIKEKTT